MVVVFVWLFRNNHLGRHKYMTLKPIDFDKLPSPNKEAIYKAINPIFDLLFSMKMCTNGDSIKFKDGDFKLYTINNYFDSGEDSGSGNGVSKFIFKSKISNKKWEIITSFPNYKIKSAKTLCDVENFSEYKHNLYGPSVVTFHPNGFRNRVEYYYCNELQNSEKPSNPSIEIYDEMGTLTDVEYYIDGVKQVLKQVQTTIPVQRLIKKTPEKDNMENQQNNSRNAVEIEKPSSFASKVKDEIKSDAIDALWRAGTTQAIRTIRDSMCLGLEKSGQNKAAEFLKTAHGELLVSFLIGVGVPASVPIIESEKMTPKIKRFAKEARVRAEAEAITMIIDPARDAMFSAIQNAISKLPEINETKQLRIETSSVESTIGIESEMVEEEMVEEDYKQTQF